MEELTKKELLDYLEEISQQLNNIALDQIPFAISELYFKLENSIPISLIEKKINELNEKMAEQLYIIKEFGEHMKIEEAKEILKDIMANTYAEGKAKAINTVLNELNKKDKVIDMIIDTIVGDRKILKLVCNKIINKKEDECFEQNKLCDDCIKEYFYKKIGG